MAEEIKEKYCYRIVRRGERGRNISVTLPPTFVAREAERHNLSIEELAKQFVVLAIVKDPFVAYKFVSKEEAEKAGYIKRWE